MSKRTIECKLIETNSWRPLMLALAERDPADLSSDVLVGMAALFFRLAANAIGREP